MPDALGRGDVAGRVAATLGAPPPAGRRALDAVLAGLTEALGAGHPVTLTRFGTFAVRPIGARRVRALRGAQAGQLLTVPAGKKPIPILFTNGLYLWKGTEHESTTVEVLKFMMQDERLLAYGKLTGRDPARTTLQAEHVKNLGLPQNDPGAGWTSTGS